MIGSFKTLSYDNRGTSYMVNLFDEYFKPKMKNINNYNLILLPGDNDIETARNNKNIIWCHVPEYNMPDELSFYLIDKDIVNNTVAYIVQSEFHRSNISEAFNLDVSKFFIIPNAFEPLPYKKREHKKHVKFFCASQQDRGADMLIESFAKIKDKDISMVYHSGPCVCEKCMDFRDKYSYDKRITIVGYTPKQEYIDNILSSDVMAYPCTFQETACIMAMEAMSGGLYIITTDLGALPDTTMGYAKIIKNFPYIDEKIYANRDKIVKTFTKEMKKSIKLIRSGKFNPDKQINAVNKRFSHENSLQQWLKLDEYLTSK